MELDAHQKMAVDFFKGHSQSLSNVTDDDLEEVMIAFTVAASGSEHANNFRIFPKGMKPEYEAIKAKGCCGSFDSEVKCRSGNVYMIGFNYGH